jgi:hypothetical protein
MALFSAASMAVGVAAFVVLAAIAHAGEPGTLADASAVIGLSFVLAVIPGAVQLRAAAQVAAGREPGLPHGFVAASSLALAVAAVPAAAALAVPAASLLLLAAQYAAACVASAQRGAFIGRADHGAASRSMLAEAAVRLVLGVPLAIGLGATGLAAALLLGSLGAVAVGWRSAGPVGAAPWRDVVGPAVAVGVLMLLVNADGLLVPRLLGPAAGDAYAIAALPGRGIFFALFTISWLAVPAAVRATRPQELARPLLLVLALGAAAGLTLLMVRPLLPIALGDPAPAARLLALLAAANTLAAALATVLAMSVARELRRPWDATLGATAALVAALILERPAAEGVAVLVLVAVAAALLLSTGRLLATSRSAATEAAGSPLLIRR